MRLLCPQAHLELREMRSVQCGRHWLAVLQTPFSIRFSFGFGWNVEGAAIATVFARFTVLCFSITLIRIHRLVAPLSLSAWSNNLKAILTIAIPAVITNIATPLVTHCHYIDCTIRRRLCCRLCGNRTLDPSVLCCDFCFVGCGRNIMGQTDGAD